MEKTYFENNPTLGGDVVIKSADVKTIGKEIFKTFEIECFESGAYFLDAWMMVPLTKDGLSEYKVAVNGVLSESSFKPQVASWQSLALTDAKNSVSTIKLRKGRNRVSIIGKGPEVPSVEFIKLSSSLSRAGISDIHYKSFVEKIKSNTSPINYLFCCYYVFQFLSPIGSDFLLQALPIQHIGINLCLCS